jgi:hypothetical protein
VAWIFVQRRVFFQLTQVQRRANLVVVDRRLRVVIGAIFACSLFRYKFDKNGFVLRGYNLTLRADATGFLLFFALLLDRRPHLLRQFREAFLAVVLLVRTNTISPEFKQLQCFIPLR